MQAEIKLTKSAIFELVTAAVEAYVVKHDYSRTIAVETFAYLFGRVNKKLPLKCTIEHISIETSAKKRRGSVEVNKVSYDFKRELASLFGDSFDYIGTMHTHPWLKGETFTRWKAEKSEEIKIETAEHVRRHQLFLLSDADHNCEVGRYFSVGNRDFSLACTLTLFAMQRANDRKELSADEAHNLYELTLGNLKIWFYMQAFEHIKSDNLTDEQIQLFGKYGLEYQKYKNCKTLPIPIDTCFDKDELTQTFRDEGFGRFSIDEDKNQGLYLQKASAETRLHYKD
jgi:hypothetical protein